MDVDNLVEFIVEPIIDSESVTRQLKMRHMEEEQKKQRRVQNILDGEEYLRRMPVASLFFEAMAQLQLQDVALNLVPMMTQQTTSGKTATQWISRPGDTSTASGSVG